MRLPVTLEFNGDVVRERQRRGQVGGRYFNAWVDLDHQRLFRLDAIDVEHDLILAGQGERTLRDQRRRFAEYGSDRIVVFDRLRTRETQIPDEAVARPLQRRDARLGCSQSRRNMVSTVTAGGASSLANRTQQAAIGRMDFDTHASRASGQHVVDDRAVWRIRAERRFRRQRRVLVLVRPQTEGRRRREQSRGLRRTGASS